MCCCLSKQEHNCRTNGFKCYYNDLKLQTSKLRFWHYSASNEIWLGDWLSHILACAARCPPELHCCPKTDQWVTVFHITTCFSRRCILPADPPAVNWQSPQLQSTEVHKLKRNMTLQHLSGCFQAWPLAWLMRKAKSRSWLQADDCTNRFCPLSLLDSSAVRHHASESNLKATPGQLSGRPPAAVLWLSHPHTFSTVCRKLSENTQEIITKMSKTGAGSKQSDWQETFTQQQQRGREGTFTCYATCWLSH